MKRNRRGLINQFILRNKALKEMGFKSYNDYLKSDIWIKTKIVWYKAKKENQLIGDRVTYVVVKVI